jgi:MFS superfamily sulfate permease-like transporter
MDPRLLLILRNLLTLMVFLSFPFSPVGLVLLLLTSVFELLPMCIVGGIIISGVMSLVDYAEAIRLWKFDKLDFCVWAVTFVGVMFLGAQLGLLCGAMLSFVMVLLQLALPRTHVLGRLPGSDAYRNIRQYPDGQSYPGCIVAGTDSPLCFLNAEVVKDKILRRAAEMDAETGVFTKYIVLDLTSSSDIDTCALHELDDWLLELNGGEEVSGAGTRQLCIVNPNSKVMRRMDQWGFVDALGREYCFCTVHDAVMWCLARLEEDEAERWEETGSCKIPDDGAASGTEGGRATSLVVVTASLSPDFDGGKESGTQGCAVNISTLEDGLHHRKPVIT